MDMTGPPPRAAWVEIRDPSGELLQHVPAGVGDGAITTDLPAFPSGTHATVQLCIDWCDRVDCEDADVKELPTGQQILTDVIG